MMKFSLRDFSLYTVILALCLGLGVTQYRMSTRLAAVEKHNTRLTGYSRQMRIVLEEAKKAHDELWGKNQAMMRKIAGPNAVYCGNDPSRFPPNVHWEILDEPEPRIGFKRPRE